MVVRRDEKATAFRGFLLIEGVEDGCGRVGLVKPKRRGVVLVEVATVWESFIESDLRLFRIGYRDWEIVNFSHYGCYWAYPVPL